MLGLAPMYLGIPPQVLTSPQVQQTICFSQGEAMLFGAAAVFGDSEWMAKMLERILPPALSICAGAVLVAHGYNVLKLRATVAEAIKANMAAQAPPAYTNGSGTAPPVDIS